MKRALFLGSLLFAAFMLACDEDLIEPATTGSISLTVIVNPPPAPPLVALAPRTSVERSPSGIVSRKPAAGAARATADSKARAVRIGAYDADARTARVARPAAQQQLESSAPSGAASLASTSAAAMIDEARIRVIGPTNRTLENQTPGSTVTVDNLAPGTYTVVLEGITAGETEHLGVTTGITVVSGQNTNATIQFNPFFPVLSDPVSPTTDFAFRVQWAPVPHATGYVMEVARDLAFTNPVTAPVNGTSAIITVPETGDFHARVRSVNNQWIPAGFPSAPKSIAVVTDIDASSDDFAGAPVLPFNFSGDLNQLNIFPEADEDWFAIDACRADSLFVETFAERLNPASELDTQLQLYDATGTGWVAENDDWFGLDSYLQTELPADGRYYVKVFGIDVNDIGHYQLNITVQPGPANTGTGCTPLAPVASIDVTPGQATVIVGGTLQLTATARDAGGNVIISPPMTWTTSDAAIANVGIADGLVTGNGLGLATISATSGGVTGTSNVGVSAGPPTSAAMAFASDRNDGDAEIYLRSADGSSITNLTNEPFGWDYSPAWSADGLKIAFVSDRTGDEEIFVMNADGSNQRNVTNNSASDFQVTWSPTGTQLAITTGRDGNHEIYVMNADGSNPVNVTNNIAAEEDPAWSPDGTRIAFTSDRDGDPEIYLMDPDGSNVVRLTDNAFEDLSPAWSPNGLELAFVTDRDFSYNVYVMNADGSAQTALTTASSDELWPAWSSDGTEIAYVLDTGFDYEIFLVASGGTPLGNLTQNVWDDAFPAFPLAGTVGPQVDSVEVQPGGVTAAVLGGTQIFSATALDAGGAPIGGKVITWTSLNPAVATINAGGAATPVGAGQATIQAEVDGVRGWALLTVVDPTAAPVNLWASMTSGTSETLLDVWGTSSDNVYAVGTNGTLLQFNGANWSTQQSNVNWSLNGIWGTATDDVFAVGNPPSGPAVIHFDGATWSPMSSAPQLTLYQVWGASPNRVFASAGDGVLSYDGTSWTFNLVSGSEAVLGVWGSSADNVYAAGWKNLSPPNGPTVLHYDGSSWVEINTGQTTALQDIWGTAPNNILAVGSSGFTLEFDGFSWNPLASASGNLFRLWGTSATDIYAVGGSTALFRFDGANWTTIASGQPNNLTSIWAAPDEGVFAVGNNGVILRGYRGASVTVTPSNVDTLIGVGDVVQFTAEARDAQNNPISGVTFTWSSDDPNVGDVDPTTGLVTARGNGTATITATAPGGETGSATFRSATMVGALSTSFGYTRSGTPMSLASDGTAYFVMYGGTTPSGVDEFDLSGNLVNTITLGIDGRSLVRDPVGGSFYAKEYGPISYDWYKVDPQTTSSESVVFTGIFTGDQTSPAIALDQSSIYEHELGNVRVLSFSNGALQTTLTGLPNGGFAFGDGNAIACDGPRLYTWDASAGTIFVSDLAGRLITSFTLPVSAAWEGYSLSYADGLLWASGSPGTGDVWYGFKLSQQ